MDRIRMAETLVRLARELVASGDGYGFYSVDEDAGSGTITVYFILEDGKPKSKAGKDAEMCRREIKRILDGKGGFDVTRLEDNQKSFSFDVVVREPDAGTASLGRKTRLVCADGDEDDAGGDAGGDSGGGGDDDAQSDDIQTISLEDDGGDDGDGVPPDEDGGPDGDGEEEEGEGNENDEFVSNAFASIEKAVSSVCEKHRWNVRK